MGRASGAKSAADYFGAAPKSGEPAEHGTAQRGGAKGSAGGGGGLKRFLAFFGNTNASRPPSESPAATRAGSSFMLMWRSTREPADILVTDRSGRYSSATTRRSMSVVRFGSVTSSSLVDRRWEASATDVVAAARLAAEQEQEEEEEEEEEERTAGKRRGKGRAEESGKDREAEEWVQRQRAMERWQRELQLQQLHQQQQEAAEGKPERLEYLPGGAGAKRTSRPQPPLLPRPGQPPLPRSSQAQGQAQGQERSSANRLEYVPPQRRSTQPQAAGPRLLAEPHAQPLTTLQGHRPSRESIHQLLPASDPHWGSTTPAAATSLGMPPRGDPVATAGTWHASSTRSSDTQHQLRDMARDMATVGEAGEQETLDELEDEFLGGLRPRTSKPGCSALSQPVATLALGPLARGSGGGADEDDGPRSAHVRWSVPTPPAAAGVMSSPPPHRERSLRHSGTSGVSAASAATATTAVSAVSLASAHSAASTASSTLTAHAASASCRTSASGLAADASPGAAARRAAAAAAAAAQRDGHLAAGTGDMRVAVLRQRTSTTGAGLNLGTGDSVAKWPSGTSCASNATAASNGSNSSSALLSRNLSRGLRATGSFDGEGDIMGCARSRSPALLAAPDSPLSPSPRLDRTSNPGGCGLALRVVHDMEARAARELAAAQRPGGGGSVASQLGSPLAAASPGPCSGSTPRWRDLLAVASAALEDDAKERGGGGDGRASLPRLGPSGGSSSSVGSTAAPVSGGWQTRSYRTLPRVESNISEAAPSGLLPATSSASLVGLHRATTEPLQLGSPVASHRRVTGSDDTDRQPSVPGLRPPPPPPATAAGAGSRLGGLGRDRRGAAGALPTNAATGPSTGMPPALPSPGAHGDDPAMPVSPFRGYTPESPKPAAGGGVRASYTGSRPAEARGGGAGGGGASEASLEELLMGSFGSSEPSRSAALSERGSAAPGQLAPTPPARQGAAGGPPRPMAARSRRLGGGEQSSSGAAADAAAAAQGALWPAPPSTEPPAALRYTSAKEVAMARY